MTRKLMRLAMAAALAFGAAAGAYQPAEAGRGGAFAAGVATGVIGLGVLGGYAHSHHHHHYHGPACYSGPERCGWSDRHCFHNRWGDWVCRGGRYRCWRPTYCD